MAAARKLVTDKYSWQQDGFPKKGCVRGVCKVCEGVKGGRAEKFEVRLPNFSHQRPHTVFQGDPATGGASVQDTEEGVRVPCDSISETHNGALHTLELASLMALKPEVQNQSVGKPRFLKGSEGGLSLASSQAVLGFPFMWPLLPR